MQLPYKHDAPLTAGELRNKLKGVSNDTPIFIVLDKSDDNYDEDGHLRFVHPVTYVERETVWSEFSDYPEKNLILHPDDNFYENLEMRMKEDASLLGVGGLEDYTHIPDPIID